MAPLDRLAEKIAAMTARPWRAVTYPLQGKLGSGVRMITTRIGDDAPLAQLWGVNLSGLTNIPYQDAAANQVGLTLLANIADELIAVARAADVITRESDRKFHDLRDAMNRLLPAIERALPQEQPPSGFDWRCQCEHPSHVGRAPTTPLGHQAHAYRTRMELGEDIDKFRTPEGYVRTICRACTIDCATESVVHQGVPRD